MSEVSLHPLNRLTTLTNRDDQALVVVGSGQGSTADATETRTALGLGDAATKATSTGGNGAADDGKIPTYGGVGDMAASAFRVISGTGFHNLVPSTATVHRTNPFPDADGTIVLDTATQTLTNKTLTSPAITTPTGIVKGDVGLGSVDNTSDANKPVSTATQAAIDAALTPIVFEPDAGDAKKYVAFPGATYIPAIKRRVVAFRVGTDHTSGGVAKSVYSDENGAWSAPVTMYDPGSADVRDLQLSHSPGTGRIYATFAVTDTGAGNRKSYRMHSTDNGASWTGLTELPAGGNSSTFVSGPLTELTSGGVCVIPGRRGTYDNGQDEIGVWRSTTGPDAAAGSWTWVQIAPYSAADQFNECGVVKTASGRTGLIARSNFTYKLYSTFFSDDDGATWTRWSDYPIYYGSNGSVIPNGSRPDAIAIGETIYMPTRLSSPNGWGWIATADYGATWHEIQQVRNNEIYEYGRPFRVESDIQFAWAREISSSEGILHISRLGLTSPPAIRESQPSLDACVGAMLTAPATGSVSSITDDSASGLTITPTSITGVGPVLGLGRTAYQFGSGSNIVLGTTTTWQSNIFNGDFSICAWVRAKSGVTDQPFFIFRNNNALITNEGLAFYLDNRTGSSINAAIRCAWKGLGYTTRDYVMPFNEWFWVCLSVRSNNISVWLNGRRFLLGTNPSRANAAAFEAGFVGYTGSTSDAFRMRNWMFLPGSHTAAQLLRIRDLTR